MADAAVSTPFMYVAVKPTGGRSFGMRYAPSQSELAASLSKEQLLLLRSWRLPNWTAREERLSLRDQAALNDQIGALVDRGVPLVEALEVAQSVVTKRAAPTVAKLRDLVSAGDSFADACAKTGAFDDVVITVYRSAERSGQLGTSAQRLAESAKRRLGISGKVVTMMIYPGLVLCLGIVVTIVVLTFIVPRIAATLEQSGGELPWYTQIVMGASNAMREQWLITMLGVGGLAVIAILLRHSVAVWFMGLLRRAPIIGKAMLTGESARFFSVMGAMTKTGVPLADALSVATGVISHPKLRSQLESLGRGLVEGGVLKNMIEKLDALPLATRRLLIAADRAGDMDQVFDDLAQDLAAQVDTQTQRAVGLLEPLLIIGVFVVIGAVLMSVMLPLMTMGSRIGGL